MPSLATGSGKRSSGLPPRDIPAKMPLATGNGRILVVEDEWFIATEIENILESAGYEVAGSAATADEAVVLAEACKPDLILMDIRLRGSRDGVDAAIEIARRLGIRSLFVSAHRDAATQERARDANPVGWLSKPFADHQLLEALKAGLRFLKS